MKRTAKWWSPAAALRRLGWTGFTPLSSLADIGEPRIGVMSDAFLQPMLFEACGLPATALERLRGSASNDPRFSQIFSVHAVNSDDSTIATPLGGRYVIDHSRLTFIPDHPLRPELAYRAVFHVPNDSDAADASSAFTIHREINGQDQTRPFKDIRRTAASVN